MPIGPAKDITRGQLIRADHLNRSARSVVRKVHGSEGVSLHHSRGSLTISIKRPPGIGMTLYPCDVESDGGSAGTVSTKCSFTYKFKDLFAGSFTNDNTLGTEATPEFDTRSAIGPYIEATKGTYYFNDDDEPTLWEVNEVEDVEAC